MTLYLENMKLLTFSVAMLFAILTSLHVKADPGDTLVVQTYTFEAQNNPDTNYDSPGRRWFDLPADDGTEYQKILMYYTLKCFEDGTAGGLGFDCGEWDYTSHTFLYEHTGELDSNALSHPRYLANNEEFDEMEFSSIPLTNTYAYEFMGTQIDNVVSETEFQVNSDMSEELSFNQGEAGRFQMFYSAADLTASGVTGVIQKIALMLEGEGTLSNFSIKSSWIADEPVEMMVEGLTEIYGHPAFLFLPGQADVLLDEAIEWDGTAGLLIDVSFDSTDVNFSVLGSAGNSYSSSNSTDKYIVFDGGDQVSIPAEIFNSIDEEVTIGYWLYGNPEFQPENGTTFEGVNEDNQRVLNVHNPWSNGQVYWDAGQDGGYDRINAQASNSDFSGQWNHWAFTKNTITEEMRIYLNGEEWLAGTDKDNSMAGITKFNIGSAAGWTNYYRGAMDNFFVLDKELSAAEIQAYMTSQYSTDLPQSANIQAYFGFNQEYGEPIFNEILEFDGTSLGNAALEIHASEAPVLSVVSELVSPWLSLFNGEYEVSESTWMYEVVEEVPPVSVIEYGVNGNAVEVVNYQSLYPVGYSYTFDTEGNAMDSISNSGVENTNLTNETLNYYSPAFEVVNRIELGRFITPYGIGLDLEEGWTWIYDVTDFEPLLRGEVELEAGNWQELLDLKFLFIEGTPPRNVKRVENIWAGNWGLGSWDENVTEQTIDVLPGEEMFKMRTTTSGHGFGSGNNCAEFCFNNHKVKVNGNTEYSWEIMQECADNPLYPQGGTWIYDRAGWCPGAPVAMREHELTEFISGDEFTVEYDIDYDPDGNYWFMGQLFSYGEINHELDVEITQILAPSDFRINSRMNPICDDPVFVITNKGSEVLTSCEIQFGINGEMQTAYWSGELGFMESEEVTLTYNVSPEFYTGDDEVMQTFEVEVLLPNGSTDQNPSNNSAKSNFFKPPTYGYDEDEDDNRIIVECQTNNTPWETQVQLKNIYGAVHWTSDYTQANTLYRDTLTLNAGCYLLHITDTDDDGLSFFANNDGNGSVRLREVGGWYYEIFEENFGKEFKHYFNFETDIYDNVEEVQVKDIRIYPNPTDGLFYLKGINITGSMEIVIHNSAGVEVMRLEEKLVDSFQTIGLNLDQMASGIYNVTVIQNGSSFSKRIVKN